jgi:hypothetical protein
MGDGRVETGDGRWATGHGKTNLRSFLTAARGPLSVARGSAIAALLLLSGCANIEPWVKPYEREALADPIMSFDAHPISTSYMHHVFEAREGARGALGSAGGGCGCN